MCRISVFCFTVAATLLVALPLSAQLPPSPNSLSSHSSRACSSGIAAVDLITIALASDPDAEDSYKQLSHSTYHGSGCFTGTYDPLARRERRLSCHRSAGTAGRIPPTR